jgi:hypothetical protein
MPQQADNEGTEQQQTQQVVDFGEVRAQKLDQKRRKTERIFFKHLLSVYCVVGASKMRPVEFLEVSEEGCSFQVPFDSNNPWPVDDGELPIRMYFSQDTYIPVRLSIQHSRPMIENGQRYVRFGCTVDKTASAYPSYVAFVNFLKMYSEHAMKDKGEVSVFYL